MMVIPALDILQDRAVQLRGGDPTDVLWQSRDPVGVARGWWEKGAERLHVIDLGNVLGSGANHEAVKQILEESPIPVQVGGGLRRAGHLREVLEARDDSFAIVATRAWREPDFLDHVASEWPGRVIVALELKDERITVRGWTHRLALNLDEGLFRLSGLDLGGVLLTDVNKEGRLEGPTLETVERAASELSVPLIYSGGVSSIEHVHALSDAGAAGCVVGTAIYTGELDLEKAMEAAP